MQRVAIDTELRRGGARAGDRIFVSGTIGDAGLGLRALAREAGQGAGDQPARVSNLR